MPFHLTRARPVAIKAPPGIDIYSRPEYALCVALDEIALLRKERNDAVQRASDNFERKNVRDLLLQKTEARIAELEAEREKRRLAEAKIAELQKALIEERAQLLMALYNLEVLETGQGQIKDLDNFLEEAEKQLRDGGDLT